MNKSPFPQVQENLITAVGVGAGIANAVIPIMILIVVYAFTHFSGIPQRRMIKDVYSADERERAICHLATHLLMVFLYRLSNLYHFITRYCCFMWDKQDSEYHYHVFLSVQLSLYLSILPVCLFVCLSVCLSA